MTKTLKNLQQQVDEVVEKLGGYWPPFAMLASIMEEVGELSREVNALEGIKVKKKEEKVNSIGDELADLLFSLLCMANFYQVNLSESFSDAIDKYLTRDKDRFT